MEWKLFPCGEIKNLSFLDRKGNPFTGTIEQFFNLHKSITALQHKNKKTIIFINNFGEVVGRGKAVI